MKFAIRKSFLLPLGLLLALCIVLLLVNVMEGQSREKTMMLGFIILPVSILFFESAFRRTIITEEGVTVIKLLRKKFISFADVTSVETVLVRKRAFLTLCAGDQFVIFSNAYANFPQLVRTLLERIPPAAISEDTRTMAAAPPVKSTDIISCWLAVALLGIILFIRLTGRF
jgi:hypothetical protein